MSSLQAGGGGVAGGGGMGGLSPSGVVSGSGNTLHNPFRRPWEQQSQQHEHQRGEFRASPQSSLSSGGGSPIGFGSSGSSSGGSQKDTASPSTSTVLPSISTPAASSSASAAQTEFSNSRRLPSPAPSRPHQYQNPRHAVAVAPLSLPPAPVQQSRLDPMMHMARIGLTPNPSNNRHFSHAQSHPSIHHGMPSGSQRHLPAAPEHLEREDVSKRRRLSSREGSEDMIGVQAISRTPSPSSSIAHWPAGASTLRAGQGKIRGGGTRQTPLGTDMPGLTSRLSLNPSNPAIRPPPNPQSVGVLHKYHPPQSSSMMEYGAPPPSPPPLMRSGSRGGGGNSGGASNRSSSKMSDMYPEPYSSSSSPGGFGGGTIGEISRVLQQLHLLSSALVQQSYLQTSHYSDRNQKPPPPAPLPPQLTSSDPEAILSQLQAIRQPLEEANQILSKTPSHLLHSNSQSTSKRNHNMSGSSSTQQGGRVRIPIDTSEVQQALARSQFARETLSQKCELLSKELDEMTAERDRYLINCQDLEERVEKLENTLQQAITDRNRDGQQYMSILTNAARIEMSKSKLDAEPDAQAMEIARLRRRNKELEERVAQLEGVLKEFKMFASKVGSIGGDD